MAVLGFWQRHIGSDLDTVQASTILGSEFDSLVLIFPQKALSMPETGRITH